MVSFPEINFGEVFRSMEILNDSSILGMTCRSLLMAVFAFLISRQSLIEPSALGTRTTGFSQLVGPETGSMISRFNSLSSSVSTFRRV